MKIIQEFNLPEDQEQYDIQYNAMLNYCAIEDVREYIRTQLKHTTVKHVETMDVLQCILNLLPPRM